MAKNSRANQNRQQTDDLYNESQRKSSEFEDMLRKLFESSKSTADQYMSDAYGKFSDMYGSYGDVARSGFADEYGKARGFARNWMDTGGFSEQDKGLFRRNALAPISGMYGQAKEDFESRNRINPYNPGYSAGQAKILRDTGHAVERAGISAESDLQSQIRQNMLSGAGLETGIAGSINTNKLAGMQGQMGAASGIGGLGGKMLDFANSQLDNMLQNRSLDFATRSALLALKNQMDPRVSGFDRAMGIAGMIAKFIVGMKGGG